jgi:hypothetical protein
MIEIDRASVDQRLINADEERMMKSWALVMAVRRLIKT